MARQCQKIADAEPQMGSLAPADAQVHEAFDRDDPLSG